MEAAGAVVGVTALSITLCDGIVRYCRAWKHQDDDVRSLSALCESTNGLLKEIRQRVQGSQTFDPSIIATLNGALRACEQQNEAIQHLSQKYAVGQGATTRRDETRKLVQKLMFPFEKKPLEELKSIMLAFRGDLDTALELLNLDLSMSTQKSLQNLHTDYSSNHSVLIGTLQSMGDQVSQTVDTVLTHELPLLGDRMSQKIDMSSNKLSSSIAVEVDHRLLVREVSMVQSVAQHIDSSRSLTEASLANLSADMTSAMTANSVQQVLSIESILKKLLEDDKDVGSMTEYLQSPIQTPSKLGLRRRKKKQNNGLTGQASIFCTCLPNLARSNFPQYYDDRRILHKVSEQFAVHERNCSLRNESQITTKYGIDFNILNRLRIFGSLDISRSPYASLFKYNILPNITYKAVVPDDAPAFRVLSRYLGYLGDEVNEKIMESCLQDLGAVFQSGHGSPHDSLTDGTTLIESAFNLMWTTTKFSPHALWRITRELLELKVGINPNKSFRPGHCDVSSILYNGVHTGNSVNVLNSPLSRSSPLVQDIVELTARLANAEIDIRWDPSFLMGTYEGGTKPWHGFKDILQILRANEDFSIATQCGKLSRAVIRRDMAAVETTLNQHPDYLEKERNIFGHCPLHLAIGWPDGLALLVKAADEAILLYQWRMSCFGPLPGTPLDYAICFGCIESSRLLANAGVPFLFQWHLFVGTDAFGPDVSQFVMDMIVNRLTLLVEFGKQKLPAATISSLQSTSCNSIDVIARPLLDLLRVGGIRTPKMFVSMRSWLGYGSLYHEPMICCEAAVALYEAGFTNVDCEVEQLTPLMSMALSPFFCKTQLDGARYLKVVQFFVQKGARLDRRIPAACISKPPPAGHINHHYRVIHRLASFAWRKTELIISDLVVDTADMTSSRIWSEIMQSQTPDPCICACASGGCRSISLALKSVLHVPDDDGLPWPGHYPYPATGLPSWKNILQPRQEEAATRALHSLIGLFKALRGEQLVEDVLRFLTFSALGLRHTCCWHRSGSRGDGQFSAFFKPGIMVAVMDPNEVEEIRDEETGLIERLDLLVDRFMKEFRQLGLPVSEFLIESWQKTMFAELTARDEMSESSRQQLMELGVIIHEHTDSTDNLGGRDGFELVELEARRKERDRADRRKREEYDEWIDGIRKSIRS